MFGDFWVPMVNCALVRRRRVSHYVFRLTWPVFGCFRVFALLRLAVADQILPISRGSFRVRSSSDISFRDSSACLALEPHRPFVSPVLCGLRLTRLTCLTCRKGCVVFVVFWFLFGFWCLWFLFGLFAWVFGFCLVCSWFCFLLPSASCTP